MFESWAIYDADGGPALSLDDARELPDGRVGVTVMTGDTTGWYVIFAEQDGQWLIDERYEIVEDLQAPG